MKSKADTFQHIVEFCNYVRTQFGWMVKTVRTDNGSEFFNAPIAKLFSELGILD